MLQCYCIDMTSQSTTSTLQKLPLTQYIKYLLSGVILFAPLFLTPKVSIGSKSTPDHLLDKINEERGNSSVDSWSHYTVQLTSKIVLVN